MSNPIHFREITQESIDSRYFQFTQQNPDAEFVSVIAKVENLEAWKNLPDIKTKTKIKEDGGWIVTAQIPTKQFLEIGKLPFVINLKLGAPVKPFLK